MRFSKNYDGTGVTTKRMSDVLSSVLADISVTVALRPDLILAAWPEIIGPKLAPMTCALNFSHGVLTVKVKNSTLYSLLVQKETPRLLKAFRQKFPKVSIHEIKFRIG